jgi:hypothetical protein
MEVNFSGHGAYVVSGFSLPVQVQLRNEDKLSFPGLVDCMALLIEIEPVTPHFTRDGQQSHTA